jgi:hypothetical protein
MANKELAIVYCGISAIGTPIKCNATGMMRTYITPPPMPTRPAIKPPNRPAKKRYKKVESIIYILLPT